MTGEVNNYEGVAGIEATAVDLGLKKGIGAAEDLGSLAKSTSGLNRALTGIGYATTAVSAIQTIVDLANGNTNAASVHALDTAVGAAVLYTASTPIGPFVAGAAIIYGISRVFWGN